MGLAYFSVSDLSNNYFDKPCPFCNETVLQNQQFAENPYSLALCTHQPAVDGHVLIIPKRHVERLDQLEDCEMNDLFQMIKKVNDMASS